MKRIRFGRVSEIVAPPIGAIAVSLKTLEQGRIAQVIRGKVRLTPGNREFDEKDLVVIFDETTSLAEKELFDALKAAERGDNHLLQKYVEVAK